MTRGFVNGFFQQVKILWHVFWRLSADRLPRTVFIVHFFEKHYLSVRLGTNCLVFVMMGLLKRLSPVLLGRKAVNCLFNDENTLSHLKAMHIIILNTGIQNKENYFALCAKLLSHWNSNDLLRKDETIVQLTNQAYARVLYTRICIYAYICIGLMRITCIFWFAEFWAAL